jgi:hypothetical protein
VGERGDGERLSADEVRDDGVGEAQADGSGLQGLAHRVEYRAGLAIRVALRSRVGRMERLWSTAGATRGKQVVHFRSARD